MELQQSPPYAEYVKKIGWKVEDIDGINIYYKQFPFIGALGKIQRIEKLPAIESFLSFCKTHHITRLVIEPGQQMDQQVFTQWCNDIKKNVTIIQSPYLPTKTIVIDISPSEEEIFKKFSEAKRRAVRRAQKNNLIIEESHDIKKMIGIKNKSAGFLGFITTHGLKELEQSFGPEKTASVLAYSTIPNRPLTTDNRQLVGGVFLVFWEDTGYYWIAGASKKGKKLFAPTLLVWEAIKVAKKYGMKKFDFVGVWDERFPKDGEDWKGFTKFKEGFGGQEVYYPNHRIE